MGFNSSNKIWKKDETAALIALFETERCLYDPNDRDFPDPNKKTVAYKRICKIMLRIRPDVSLEEIKYKIKVLRKQYEGELLHRNISIDAGLCSKDSYKPGMWCFGLLQFLDPYINVKTVEEKSKANENSDKEIYASDNDYNKDAEESSDVADDSDDYGEIEERISSKKRKTESSSSSERESMNSSIRKFLSSSSEKKHQTTSVSVKKYQSSPSVQNQPQTSSSVARKSHNNSSTEKNNKNPSPIKNSQDIASSHGKLPNSLSSHKKISNSPSLKNPHSTSHSSRNMPSSSNFVNRKNSSFENEPKSHSPEINMTNQSPIERDDRCFFPTPKEAKINSLEKELFNTPISGKELDVSENVSQKNLVDREDIFGRYVACELRALRSNPLLYLQTKQSILENLNSANFELIHPE